jgi:hypothetical protein
VAIDTSALKGRRPVLIPAQWKTHSLLTVQKLILGNAFWAPIGQQDLARRFAAEISQEDAKCGEPDGQ